MFSRDGNFRVHLEKVQLYLGDDDNNPISISEDMLLQIKLFQSLLFSKDPQLMHFSHPVLNESSTDESYYIAPLKRNGLCYCYNIAVTTFVNVDGFNL